MDLTNNGKHNVVDSKVNTNLAVDISGTTLEMNNKIATTSRRRYRALQILAMEAVTLANRNELLMIQKMFQT
jgi:hypothetical protein